MINRVGVRWIVTLSAALVAVLAGVLAGSIRVHPDEVAVWRRGEGPGAVLGEGFHWRPPLVGSIVRLPVRPIALHRDLELRTPEGAAVVLRLDGRFAVTGGREAHWCERAGWRPFFDGVFAVAAEELGRAVGSGAAVGSAETMAELQRRVAARLADAGASVERLLVSVPWERNPALLAQARHQVTRFGNPTGRKVLVVGWDGADWMFLDPLLRAGRLPNLARLIAGGVRGELRSEPPLLSPLVWTTMATGKPVVEHGIADFMVRDVTSGSLVPIGSDGRKVNALWNILTAFGLRSDIVGYWATWPAEPIHGTMVSDRVAYQLFGYDAGSDPRGKVHPPEAWEEVRRLLVSAADVSYQEVRRFIGVSEDEYRRAWEELPPEQHTENRINHLRKVIATTASYHRIGLHLLERQADLTIVYYEGTDTIGHLFARFLPPRLPDVDPADIVRYGQAMPEYYVWADELLGELLAKADDDTVVILASDHGFYTGEARPASDPGDFATGAPQWHRLFGVLVASDGRGRGAEIRGATIFDLTPTILAILGLPVAADMRGRVLEEVLPRGIEPSATRLLASYEALPRIVPQAVERSPEADRERMRELVALGYISPGAIEGPGGTPAPPRPTTTATAPVARSAADAEGEDQQGLATAAYNRGRILQNQGDLDGAAAQFELAISRNESFGTAYASLAQTHAVRGDHSRAFDILVRGFSRSQTMPMSTLTGMVEEANRCGRLPAAAAALDHLRPWYEEKSAYHAALGYLAQFQGDLDGALAHYRRALAINPLDELSIEASMEILLARGRSGEAKALLSSSLERSRGSVPNMNLLAIACLRQGWNEEAETIIRRILASDPGNPGLMRNLAIAVARQGRQREAVALLRQAIERSPDDAQSHFNLGAMLAELGEVDEALVSFQEAERRGLRTARLYVAIAKMQFRMGDRDGARRQLEKALRIDPNDREVRELLAALS
jgi:Tfp pilus assembly protein PilF